MSTSENSAIESIRYNLRTDKQQRRKNERLYSWNQRRHCLGVYNPNQLTYHEVKSLSIKVRNRHHVTRDDLTILKNAFVQSEKHINTFLRIEGSMMGLVHILADGNPDMQLEAACCCCNLSLGNEQECFRLAKLISPYLILHLHGVNTVIQDVCIWTLGNLAGSGRKTWTILRSQHVVNKLMNILNAGMVFLVPSTIYALIHYVRTGFDAMSENELQWMTVVSIQYLNLHKEASCLVYLLSNNKACDSILIDHNIIGTFIDMYRSWQQRHNYNTNNLQQATSMVRIIANLCSSNEGCMHVLNSDIKKFGFILSDFFNWKYSFIQQEILWMVSNILKYSSDVVKISKQFCDFKILMERIILKYQEKQNNRIFMG